MKVVKYHALLSAKPAELEKLRATEANLRSSPYQVSIDEVRAGIWELHVESDTRIDAELLSAVSFLSGIKRSWVFSPPSEP